MNDPANKDKVGTAIVGKAACGDVIKLQVSCPVLASENHLFLHIGPAGLHDNG